MGGAPNKQQAKQAKGWYVEKSWRSKLKGLRSRVKGPSLKRLSGFILQGLGLGGLGNNVS